MSFLGDLLIRLRAETADFQQDMGKAASSAERSLRQIDGAVAKLGATLSAGGFLLLAKQSLDANDHLSQLSKTTDIAVDQLAGLSIAAKQTGGDLDSIAKSVNKLSVEIGKSPDKFKALGVSAKDPLEAFKQLSDVFVSIKDPQLRAAVAAEALGKSWAGAAPLLAQGGEKIGEIVEKGAKLSGVTKEITEQANALNDKIVLLTGTGGLMTRMLGPALPLLNSLADSMLKAQEKAGTLNTGMSPLLETLKALVILGANVSFTFDTIGKDIARAIENVKLIAKGDFAGSRALGAQFKKDAEEARKALDEWTKTVLAIGKTGSPTAPGGSTAKDPAAEAAAKAAAARARAFLGGAGKDDAERLRQLDTKGWVDHAEAVLREAEDEDKALAKISEDYWANEDRLKAEDIKGWVEHADAVLKQAEEEDLALAKLADSTKKTNDWARQLGLTFTSAFEDAVAGGKKFSDILKSIGQDIAKLIIRKKITEPAGDALSKALDGMDLGSIFGGGSPEQLGGPRAIGGPVFGGTAHLVGENGPELFVPGGTGSIVPNGGMMGGVSIVQHIAIDSRSDQASILAAMRAAKEAAKGEIAEAMRRGDRRFVPA